MCRWKILYVLAALVLAEEARASSGRRKIGEGRPSKSHNAHPADGQPKCQVVADSFTSAGLGPASMVPSQPIHDPELEVCFKGSEERTRRSCCAKNMEHHFVQNAEMDFYVAIKSTSSALKDTLADNSQHYQNQFLSMITSAENQTDILLGEVYKIPATDRHALLHNLFTDLQLHIRRSRVSVRDSVDRFFDELFPLVFHNLLNDPTVTNLDEDYRECLTEIRQQLNPRPFGDVPHRLAHTLTQALLSARIFLEALNIGADAINTTDRIMLEPQCVKSIARLRYCGQCDGHIGARPCRSFCYNVMRGCLATTAEIDRHWNEYVDSLKLLTNYMQGSYNIEEVLRGLHTRVSEAIMHSMETGHKFYARLVTKCGHPKASSKHSGPSSNIQTVDTAKTPGEGSGAASHLMGERLDNFMRSLMASKGFYHNLADTLCGHEKFATGLADQDHCWNGHTLGRYNKTLVPVDLVVQMSSNPEMTVTARRSNSIVTLIDKLIHVKKLLNSKISREFMQADAWKPRKYKERNYGYGYSGDDAYVQRDDEDFNSGSGGYDSSSPHYAGSGTGPPYDHQPISGTRDRSNSDQDTDIYIDDPSQEPPTYKVTPGSAGHGSGAGSTSSCVYTMTSLLLTTSLLLSYTRLWFNG